MVSPPDPVEQGSFNLRDARQHPPSQQGEQGNRFPGKTSATEQYHSPPDRQSPRDNQPNSPAEGHSTRPRPDDSVSSSVPTLRFPRPQGSQQLAIWVSSSSPDIMASRPHSQDFSNNSLCESSFEFIPREVEETSSQDERADSMSESLSEFERYPNPEEVQAFHGLDDMSVSVASTMATDSEAESELEHEAEQESENEGDGDNDHTHSGRSFSPYERPDADEILRSSLDQPRPFPLTSSATIHTGSIEFAEPDDADVHIDKISVKHTIREFSEEEAAAFFEKAGLGHAPNRLSATIRQTMSQDCLSTNEVFHVLYVGDVVLQGEIILKISRAITCSSSGDYNANKMLERSTEGVYNIVPVTFGAVKDRDVELMQASAFQIKVDTCIDAERIPIDSSYFSDDIIYSLTLNSGNGGKKYKSVPAGGPEGARIQPAWTLPHVAVFFCSDVEHESDESLRILRTTLEFCRRHAIPTLFISEASVFDGRNDPDPSRWLNCMHEHAVCVSLESRDSKTELRFPIDVNSFLDIDNRQMNQNLAFLTGLQKSVTGAGEKTRKDTSSASSEQGLSDVKFKGWKASIRETADSFLERWDRDHCYRWSVVILGLMAALTTYVEIIAPCFTQLSASDSTPVPEVVSGQAPAATATITINHTSTKTVRIAETPSFGGLLSDIAHTVSSEGPKRTLCSVQPYSSNEILLKLSSGTKEAWLAKGAIDIDVFRGDTAIQTRLSSTDEGIIIEIPYEEAHGVVDVSIITTRKPKINETFAVDFGPDFFDDLYKAFESAQTVFHGAAQKVGDTADGVYKFVSGSANAPVLDKATSWWDSIKEFKRSAQGSWSKKAEETYDWMRDSIRPDDAVTFLKDVRQMAKDRHRHVEDFRDESELALIKAQIASKLWWLKIQGHTEQFEAYEREARKFMAKKHSEFAKAKKARQAQAEAAACARTGSCKDKGRWSI